MDETLPPRWLPACAGWPPEIPPAAWGSARAPVIVTSSNFGVGSLYAFTRDHDARHLAHGTPFATVDLLRREFGWGEHVQVFSHACVTAHLGLAHAPRAAARRLADRVLVFSFDFVSPFVAGGFHSLKILNGADARALRRARDGLDRPRRRRGVRRADARGRAVPARGARPAQRDVPFHRQPARRRRFRRLRRGDRRAAGGRRVWVKGHGTGTLEAGRLEAEVLARQFPGAPLTVSGKAASATRSAAAAWSNSPSRSPALRGGRSPGKNPRHGRRRGAEFHRHRRARAVRQRGIRRRGSHQQRLRRRPCRDAAHP
jgi:hypothetical protein